MNTKPDMSLNGQRGQERAGAGRIGGNRRCLLSTEHGGACRNGVYCPLVVALGASRVTLQYNFR